MNNEFGFRWKGADKLLFVIDNFGEYLFALNIEILKYLFVSEQISTEDFYFKFISRYVLRRAIRS